MTDLALRLAGGAIDLALGGGTLALEEGLASAVLVSLFSDHRAASGEVPAGADPRGWWGDALLPPAPGDRIGSRLWLLAREKSTEETRARAEDYAREALAWLVEDGIAERVEVAASWAEPRPAGWLRLVVTVHRPGEVPARYAMLWSGTLGLMEAA